MRVSVSCYDKYAGCDVLRRHTFISDASLALVVTQMMISYVDLFVAHGRGRDLHDMYVCNAVDVEGVRFAGCFLSGCRISVFGATRFLEGTRDPAKCSASIMRS